MTILKICVEMFPKKKNGRTGLKGHLSLTMWPNKSIIQYVKIVYPLQNIVSFIGLFCKTDL